MGTIGLATQLDLEREKDRREHESKMAPRFGVRMTGEKLMQQQTEKFGGRTGDQPGSVWKFSECSVHSRYANCEG